MKFNFEDNFDPYNVFLAIATNIPQRLKTGFVEQGHIFKTDGQQGNKTKMYVSKKYIPTLKYNLNRSMRDQNRTAYLC